MNYKYFGVTTYNKSNGRIRTNQNLLYGPNNDVQIIKYTHYKELSINDNYRYLKYKKQFRRLGWNKLSDHVKSYLLKLNPYYFSKF